MKNTLIELAEEAGFLVMADSVSVPFFADEFTEYIDIKEKLTKFAELLQANSGNAVDVSIETIMEEFESCYAFQPTRSPKLSWVNGNCYKERLINEDFRGFMNGYKKCASLANKPEQWKCYHCNEVFTDEAKAAEHFGTKLNHEPACQIDIAKFREMEALHDRAVQEDTETDRAMYAMQGKHREELIRAEELGYSRGVSDMQNEAITKG